MLRFIACDRLIFLKELHTFPSTALALCTAEPLLVLGLYNLKNASGSLTCTLNSCFAAEEAQNYLVTWAMGCADLV